MIFRLRYALSEKPVFLNKLPIGGIITGVILTLILSVLNQPLLQADVGSAAGITITNPVGPTAFGEAQDYATLEWNDPWDMSDPLDIRQLDSPQCVYPNHFNLITPCQDGFWCGQVRNDVSNPDFFLLHPGFQSGLNVGRNGHIHPIDANTYTQLTFRMYIDAIPTNDLGLQVFWTNGSVADIGANPAKFGETIWLQTFAGWHIYTINLSQVPLLSTPTAGTLPWSGNITGLRIDPGFQDMNGRIVYVDWARLTPPQSRRIEWTTDQVGATDIKLQSGSTNDSLLVYTTQKAPVEVKAENGFFDIPASLPSGDWYIQLQTNGQFSSLAGPWQIQTTPTMEFLSPSFTSGIDYATAELNNPWDMNSATDIYNYGGMTPPVFSGGTLSATSLDTNGDNDCTPYWEDPYINLLNDHVWEGNPSPPIDTSKYRYLSFRLQVNGTPDISYGWVSRVIWSNADTTGGFKLCGASEEIPIHAGWNQVILDLWDPTVVDNEDFCTSTWQATTYRNQIRFDPVEIPTATTFYLDDIYLTANSTAPQNGMFNVRYALNKTNNINVQFYFDTDSNPNNGRTIATEFTPLPVPSSPFSIYLPIVLKAGTIPETSGSLFMWDLTGVSPGTYYLSADVNDGYQTTTWYSEAPIIITP